MARGFYTSVRRHFQNASITLLAPHTLSGLTLDGLFDHQIYYHRKRPIYSLDRIAMFRALRREHFDLAFGLPFSLSSAFELWASGARRRIAFAERGAEWMLTDPVRWAGRDSHKHKSDLYLELCDVLGIHHRPDPMQTPLPGTASRWVVLAPGASIELREWPFFPELARELNQRFPDLRLILVGSAREAKWKERFDAAGVKYEDRIGKTSLAEVVSLCSQSSLVVANDSGAAHLSATMAHAPTLILFGPGDPHYVLPRGPEVHAVHVENLRCRPCESATCHGRYGIKTCLNSLSVKQVLEKASALL